MCFSAEASFIASGGLTVLGAATYAASRKKDKILVAIPILFGIQQFLEGVQWVYLDRGSSSLFAGYGFLFFALMVWPVYVPAFARALEKDERRRKLLGWFVAAGAALAAFFLFTLITERLRIQVRNSCVAYTFNLPSKDVLSPLYLGIVTGSLFLSSRLIFKWFGAVILALAGVAYLVYERNFISVWCFFAAIVSAMFFVYVQRRRSRRVPAPE